MFFTEGKHIQYEAMMKNIPYNDTSRIARRTTHKSSVFEGCSTKYRDCEHCLHFDPEKPCEECCMPPDKSG